VRRLSPPAQPLGRHHEFFPVEVEGWANCSPGYRTSGVRSRRSLRPWGLLACASDPLTLQTTAQLTLLVHARWSISNAMGVSFSSGMTLVSLAFKRRV
jgi:hypothetical protein